MGVPVTTPSQPWAGVGALRPPLQSGDPGVKGVMGLRIRTQNPQPLPLHTYSALPLMGAKQAVAVSVKQAT